MEQFKGFTRGIDETLWGAVGVFGTVGNRFGLFKQASQESTVIRNNIEYLDEMQENDQFVPRYPDLDEPDDFITPVVPPPVSQSFIDVPIDPHSKYNLSWKPDSDEDDDFLVIESTKIDLSSPYKFLPFSQTMDMCNRKVHNWLQHIWFLPSDWRISLKIIPPKPQLVPFFVFEVTTSTNYEATVLVDPKDSSSLGKKWLPAVGSFSCVYSEIIACGSCSVNLKLVQKLLTQSGFSYQSQRILPSDPPEYNPTTTTEQILPLEITKEEAWESSGRLRVQEWQEQRAREDIKSRHEFMGNNVNDRIRNLRIEPHFTTLKHFIILLPIYFTGFEYAAQTYEVLVSGNLGVVVGDRPIGTGAGGKYLLDKIKSVGNLVSETVPL